MNLGTSLGELKSKCAARIRSCNYEALLDFAGQVAHDDLLPTRLYKKPKPAKPRKARGKAFARAYTWVRPAEHEARTVPVADCLRRIR
jgi:hypothetical protein